MRLQPGTHQDPDRNLPPGYSSCGLLPGGEGEGGEGAADYLGRAGTAGGSHVMMSSPLTRVGLEFQR